MFSRTCHPMRYMIHNQALVTAVSIRCVVLSVSDGKVGIFCVLQDMPPYVVYDQPPQPRVRHSSFYKVRCFVSFG